MNKTVISSLILISYPILLLGQSEGLPRAYPLEMETLLYHETYLKITYTQALAATSKLENGMLWQLGANEPAEIMTTGDLLVGKDTLAAGAYSIFTLPNDSTWTIIINKDVGLFGTHRYNEKMDLFRIEAAIIPDDSYNEHLKITFSRKGVPVTDLVIHWKKIKLSIPVHLLEQKEN
jgi:hypothetical protein